jgi:hypothetical protein
MEQKQHPRVDTRMKHQETCIRCEENQCEIRKTCFDDATTTKKRKQILFEIPKVTN